MKIIYKDDMIVFYIKEKINIKEKKELEIYLKELIVLLKKKKIDIKSGLYIARIYENKRFGLIIELENIEELEYFKDMIDLKILIHNDCDLYLKIDDYFLLSNTPMKYFDGNYYVDISLIDNKTLFSISEFCDYIYGDELLNIKEKLIKIK